VTAPDFPGFGVHGSRIVGFGHYQPEQVLTNEDLSRIVDTNDEWILSRTGIRTRHVAAADETVASMAAAAGRMAIADAGVDASSLSMVIVASTTSTHRSPNAAGRVAVELGLSAPAVLDINTACSGFEYALALGDQAVRAGSAERVLVVGSEKLTAFTDWTDRTTCVLTADAAGAVVIERASPALISPVVWGSVPSLLEAVRIDGKPEYFAQEGRSVYRWAISSAERHARAVIDAAGLTTADIDVFAFHQANLRIVQPLAEALGADARLVITDVVDSGNTSAASVPLGLSKAWHSGELPENATVLLFGFGGGFTHAGQVARTPGRAAGAERPRAGGPLHAQPEG
jgi:3-oxoacyl-[acyl-carrier-protein] synthase-3